MSALEKLIERQANGETLTSLEFAVFWCTDRVCAEKAAEELAANNARLQKVENTALIAGNLLIDVKKYLETKIRKTSVATPMEDEIDALKYINAFQDLHGEMVKELGEKYAALRGEQ